MNVITLVAMLIVVVALVSTLVAEREAPKLRPVRIKVRREQDRQ